MKQPVTDPPALSFALVLLVINVESSLMVLALEFYTKRLDGNGMVAGMATTKITITLPDAQLEEIRQRVAAHESPSISGLVQRAVQRYLENDAEFEAHVDKALMETGGPISPKERAWARKMLAPRKVRTKSAKPRKAA